MNILYKTTLLWVCLSFSVILSSCSTVKISKENVAPIKTIQINPDVIMGAQFFNATVEPYNVPKIENIEKKYNIHYKTIIINELVKQINASKKFHVVEHNADAVMTIAIYQYGFNSGGISIWYMNTISPLVAVKGEMVKNGVTIWSDNGVGNMLTTSESLTVSMQEIEKNPEKLRRTMTIAAERAV